MAGIDFDVARNALKPFEADMKKSGGEVLNRLFQKSPDTLPLFGKFASIPKDQLAGNAAVEKHGETVLKKLCEVLTLKDKYKEGLKPLADTHYHTHKIEINHFKTITAVIIDMMKEQRVDAKSVDEFEKAMNGVISEMDNLYRGMGGQLR